jgi:sulfatase maturation enzyme AslB (radical SAM superfamily)
MNYFELQPENNIFKTVSIQTTYKCQLACANCYLGDMLNNPELPNVEIEPFNDILSRLPFRTDIRFIGAEPTMNPELPALLQATRTHGHRPSLLTNGLKLRREDYVQTLKSAGLNMIGLSMNGGLDDDVYQEFDNGKYAKLKMIALDNCFKYNILPHINVIIDPTNIHVIPDLIAYIVECAQRHNRTFSKHRFPVMLRIKSIGKIGNYRDTYTYSLTEMIALMSKLHPVDTSNLIDGHKESQSVIYPIETDAGTMFCKITDWTVDDDGVPDSNSERRGILTDDGLIAPFFEFYGKHHNEAL